MPRSGGPKRLEPSQPAPLDEPSVRVPRARPRQHGTRELHNKRAELSSKVSVARPSSTIILSVHLDYRSRRRRLGRALRQPRGAARRSDRDRVRGAEGAGRRRRRLHPAQRTRLPPPEGLEIAVAVEAINACIEGHWRMARGSCAPASVTEHRAHRPRSLRGASTRAGGASDDRPSSGPRKS